MLVCVHKRQNQAGWWWRFESNMSNTQFAAWNGAMTRCKRLPCARGTLLTSLNDGRESLYDTKVKLLQIVAYDLAPAGEIIIRRKKKTVRCKDYEFWLPRRRQFDKNLRRRGVMGCRTVRDGRGQDGNVEQTTRQGVCSPNPSICHYFPWEYRCHFHTWQLNAQYGVK